LVNHVFENLEVNTFGEPMKFWTLVIGHENGAFGLGVSADEPIDRSATTFARSLGGGVFREAQGTQISFAFSFVPIGIRWKPLTKANGRCERVLVIECLEVELFSRQAIEDATDIEPIVKPLLQVEELFGVRHR
jgi:hypothetical protein